MAYTDNIVALNAVTGTTTSAAYDVSLRENLSVQVVCASHTSGNGVFTVDASNDGTNWTTGIAMRDVTSTAPTTYVTSKTLSANGTAMLAIPDMAFKFIRVVCTVTTDGAYTATLQSYGD